MHNDSWETLYRAAEAVRNARRVSPFLESGAVASALLTDRGNIYVGVCIDSACSLGMCAERNAAAAMLTHGENRVRKLVTVMPDGRPGLPCGACRELLMQLDRESGSMEILLDLPTRRTVRLSELMPDWWGASRFAEQEAD